ncbi:hypothetical protein EHQ79_06675 [Leptospira jelokensis]|nr:hypothetical protein EHQ79_06675 [Leptospira jelokensis]
MKRRITAGKRFASARGLAWAAPHFPSVTRLHPQTPCQSLTSLRDSGSGNVVSPSSLSAISGMLFTNFIINDNLILHEVVVVVLRAIFSTVNWNACLLQRLYHNLQQCRSGKT